MTKTIKNLIKDMGLVVCPFCDGDGEIGAFCGHETIEPCRMCDGKGVVRSTKKQKHSKKCQLCNGRKGGCGRCYFDPKGLIEWESYELFEGTLKK